MTTWQDTLKDLHKAATAADLVPSFPAPPKTLEALRRVAPNRAARFALANELEKLQTRAAQ